MADFDDGASDTSLGFREYAGLDDLIEPDESAESRNDQRDSWNQLPIEDKWDQVMKILRDQGRPCRWDNQCGDAKVDNFLDDYWKNGLRARDDRDPRSPTVLHVLAKDFDKSGFASLDGGSQSRIINFLLDHQKREATSQASHKTNHGEDPILIVALRNDNKDFIQCVHRYCMGSIQDLLEACDVEGTNSLHHIFKVHFPRAIDDYFKKRQGRKLDLKTTYPLALSLTNVARAETVTAQDRLGNTPFHYAMNYALCRIPSDNHPKIISQLIAVGDDLLSKGAKMSQFNYEKDPESPYLYLLRTKKEYLMGLQNKRSSRLATQDRQSEAKMTTQKGTANEAKSKAQLSKDSSASRTTKADESRDYSEGWKAMHLGIVNERDMARKGKISLSSSAQQVVPRHTAMETTADTKDIGLADVRSGHGLARHPTARTSSPVPTTVRNPRNTGQPQIETDYTIQMPTPPSEADVASAQQPKMLHTASTKPNQKTAQTSQMLDDVEVYRKSAEKILHRLKLHYVRTRSDIDAKDLLYGKVASDKNLYFDATHLESPSADDVAELINMLSNSGGFEDALSYVYLPCLSLDGDKLSNKDANSRSYTANQRRPRDSRPQSDLSTGRDSLVAVFNALAKAGVRNISYLSVDDMYENTPSHSDASIERSIRGADSFFAEGKRTEGEINIEIWDWMRLDLSIDVIRFASPKVVKIHLYWSGNQTVLRGWACNEGIPRLYFESDKKMTKVVLHASPGIESGERMSKTLNQFKDEIKKNTKGEVNIVIGKPVLSKTAGLQGQPLQSGAGQFKTPPEHEWVKSMEEFRRSLVSIHRNMPKQIQPRRIKVALIDDGVHLGDLNTYNKSVQVTGLSYWTPKVSAEGTMVGQSWHQSTHGHGTIMANMFVRLNPWVDLHVIRIQDQFENARHGSGVIKIHAKSAADAIRAAIIRDVDIISMSWTVRDIPKGDTNTKSPSVYEKGSIEELKEAIEDAKTKNILMFCSAADDIQARSTESLPYAQAPHYIFRIGAAGASGQRDASSEDHPHINWFFPGNRVAEAEDPRSKKILEYHSGSSVSTALAAGLASLIMYLPRLIQAYHEHAGNESDIASKYANYAEGLRTRDNMRKAFDNITDETHEDRKFLPVWHLFGRRAGPILESQSPGTKGSKAWDILEELVTELCFKINL